MTLKDRLVAQGGGSNTPRGQRGSTFNRRPTVTGGSLRAREPWLFMPRSVLHDPQTTPADITSSRWCAYK